jgi:homoserine O-succinyltransferase
MNLKEKKLIRVAILDLYEGEANQGMRCIRDILTQYEAKHDLNLEWTEFEVRQKFELPDTSFDVYISSGGPGSPLDSEGSEWEKSFFNWLQEVERWNDDPTNLMKKYIFLICHSFQLVCRQYKLALVSKRKSTAFGVFPIHILPEIQNEPIFEGLDNPFYAVESRDYQITQPHNEALQEMGATVLCIEKERPHIPLERAIMAIRFNEYMVGTQFHPEADAVGMSMYLQREDKKKYVIEHYGEEKWQSMIKHLNDPDKISWTYSHVLPNFLNQASEHLQIAGLVF